jgi:two-component system, OmpR family, response regulator
MARILVVEDEENLAHLLVGALRLAGFDVQIADTGRGALRAVDAFRPDLVLLDVMLPDLDGFAVHERLRERSSARLPVIFLTARQQVEDRLRGLTGGADDYIGKPFSLEELIARVQAVLRRTGSDIEQPHRLVYLDLELDEQAHEVRRGGTVVSLTSTEFSVLRYLLANAGRVLSKAQILEHVWHYDFGGESNIVEVYVSNLRKKLDGLGPPLIQTVRGVGYVLRDDRR